MTRYRKVIKGCEIETRIVGKRRYFKCKGIKRVPTAQEIIEELRK